MRNFSSTALLLFPKTLNTETRYMTLFNGAVRNLLKYFEIEGITPQCFNTDMMAIKLHYPGIQYLSPLSESDEFFARNNCEDMDIMPAGIPLSDFSAEALKKHPNVRGLTREQRFELLQKRELFAVRKYLKTCRVAVSFAKGKNQSYKLESKEGDGLLRLYIEPSNLIVKPFISGKELLPGDVFKFSSCTRPINQWNMDEIC